MGSNAIIMAVSLTSMKNYQRAIVNRRPQRNTNPARANAIAGVLLTIPLLAATLGAALWPLPWSVGARLVLDRTDH